MSELLMKIFLKDIELPGMPDLRRSDELPPADSLDLKALYIKKGKRLNQDLSGFYIIRRM